MYLSRIDPKGIFCQLNLSGINIWRLELASVRSTGGKILGIGVRYVDAGSTAVSLFAGIEIPESTDDTVSGIVANGFHKGSKTKDRERFAETLKILHNSKDVKPRQVDEIIPKALDLVDVYYQSLQALTHNGEASSEYYGWKWAIHKDRFNIAWSSRGPTPPEEIQ